LFVSGISLPTLPCYKAEISDESALLDEEEKLLEEDIQGSGEDDAELSMVEAASSDKPTRNFMIYSMPIGRY
jgi:hypothetical protein